MCFVRSIYTPAVIASAAKHSRSDGGSCRSRWPDRDGFVALAMTDLLLGGSDRCRGSDLLRGSDHDLDQDLGPRKIGADAGAGRRVLRVDPLVPHRVHVAEERHVLDPQIGDQKVRFAGARLAQIMINALEDLRRLPLDVLARIAGGQYAEIDRVAAHDAAAYARNRRLRDVDAADVGHMSLPRCDEWHGPVWPG